nr:efflux RND transporter permease subunit [Anaerolineae bacterium]
NAANINLVLVDKADRQRTTSEVVDAMRSLFRNLPDAIVSVSLNSGVGGGGESPIQFRLAGPDPDKLIELSEEVEEIMLNTPGTADVTNTDAARSPESRLVVDRQQALDLDLAPASVATTLRTSLSGSTVGKFEPSPGATEVDIVLRMNEQARQDVTQLLQVPVDYVQGQPILLDRVVDLERGLAAARITRSDRQRVLTVGSGITSGRGTGDVTNDIEAAVQERVEFPAGYSYQVVGTSEVQRESFAQLGQSILLAILLVYMLLVALFQSWLQPLAIMFSLPVALVGAFGGLALTGNTLNLNSILGVIVLVGVVTKNAILLVDFTNNLREQGYERKEALVSAGRLRLRAVLMTTLTLVFALMPLLLGAGAGSESRAPLAAVVVGGVITSTLLTLILIPVIYNFFDWGSGMLAQILGTVWGSSKPADEQTEPEERPEGETPEERQPEGKPEKDDKGSKRPQTPRPSPQPGSAMSFGSPE